MLFSSKCKSILTKSQLSHFDQLNLYQKIAFLRKQCPSKNELVNTRIGFNEFRNRIDSDCDLLTVRYDRIDNYMKVLSDQYSEIF